MLQKLIYLALITLGLCLPLSAQEFDQKKYNQYLKEQVKPKEFFTDKNIDYFKNINSKIKEQKYDEALSLVNKLDQEELNHVELTAALQFKIAAQNNLGNYTQSLEDYKKLIEIPTLEISIYSQLLMAIGTTYKNNGESRLALEYLDQYFLYTPNPQLKHYVTAFEASLMHFDFNRATKYVDLVEKIHLSRIKGFSKDELEQNKNAIETNRLGIEKMRKKIRDEQNKSPAH